MAFLTKVGNMLRQTANRQITSEISASRPSIYQAIRCMSSSKLFVGGISFQTDDNSLKEAFDKYGNVVEARIIMDRDTGRSRGFGFVTYTSSEEASSAIQALDGQDLHGRRVRVNYATERPQRTFNDNYGNYGGGGNPYSSGGYGTGGGYSSGGGYGTGGGYGSGDGGNYGGRNVNYGDGKTNYAGQNTYDGGAGNYGVAGGGGGGGGGGGSNDYASTSVDGGYDGNAGLGYGGGNQFGANESGGGGGGCGFNQDDALDTNYKDDVDSGDFAKRA